MMRVRTAALATRIAADRFAWVRPKPSLRRVVALPSLPASVPSELTDDEACLAAYQSQLDYIYRAFLRLGARSIEVDDLMQDLFIALRRSWPIFDKKRPLRPYLFGIAFRVTSSHRRKHSREIAVGFSDIDDPRPGPEEALRRKRSGELVLRALERVPLPRRVVVAMHEIDEIPVAEIARSLSLPLFTVYSRLRKGRHELGTALRRLLRETEKATTHEA